MVAIMSDGAGLRAWLGQEGVLAEAVLRAAVQRQQIYGGTLDTALLERGTMTENALWERLAAATGLPPPRPDLCDPGRSVVFSPPLASPPFAAEVTRALRTVPVRGEGHTVDFLCAEPVARDAIRQLAEAHGLAARLYVVPETRLLAMRHKVYVNPCRPATPPSWPAAWERPGRGAP